MTRRDTRNVTAVAVTPHAFPYHALYDCKVLFFFRTRCWCKSIKKKKNSVFCGGCSGFGNGSSNGECK